MEKSKQSCSKTAFDWVDNENEQLPCNETQPKTDASNPMCHRWGYNHLIGKIEILQNPTIFRRIEIIMLSQSGFHLRVIARFVQSLAPFTSTIKVRKGETVVDGKSILGLMSLGVSKNERVEIKVAGDDANQATQVIDEFFLKAENRV